MVATVAVAGVQLYRDRFNRRFEDAPPISQWRCNLTGLSQVHNLYFVAYRSDIYVYVPQFPKQALSQNPVLIFTCEPSENHLPGYIDRRHPHSINNLIVQFLGNQEVIAAARDDGDVDAYWMHNIVHAIERRAENPGALLPRANPEEVHPFFQFNVDKSAWGLALHAEARLLAVSANTHEVTVVQFGLHHSEGDAPLDEDYEVDVDAQNERTEVRQDRDENMFQRLTNGEANIPYIAFCNTGDDPAGRFLLTTDLDGMCRVIDLLKGREMQRFRFGSSFTVMNPNNGGERFDRINAGWISMFLDRRSFMEEEDVCSALGLQDDDTLPWSTREQTVWDISGTVKQLPEHYQHFYYHKPRRRTTAPRAEDSGTVPLEDSDAQPAGENDNTLETEESMESGPSSEGGVPLDVETEIPEESLGLSEEQIVETESAGSESATSPPSEDGEEGDQPTLIDDGLDPEDEMTEDTTPFTAWYSGQTTLESEPQFAVNSPDFRGKLPCPIIHSSVRNVFLLQPSIHGAEFIKFRPEDRFGFEKPWIPPMVGLANPLRQAIQQDMEYLRVFERLNMGVYIPPLGIVVMASQKGRAVVLALTKVRGSGKPRQPEERIFRKGTPQKSNAPNPSKVPNWVNKTNYAMRLECILPFAHQEKANKRPFAPLIGMAASPLQGFLGNEGGAEGVGKNCGAKQDRWRLMMTYMDHSILSYEIGRQTGMPGGVEKGVHVEDLVV